MASVFVGARYQCTCFHPLASLWQRRSAELLVCFVTSDPPTGELSLLPARTLAASPDPTCQNRKTRTMPCFRGIEVFVVARSDSKRLPEFPHPDGSSVRLRGPTEASASPLPSPSPEGTNSDPTRLQKVNPRISVYIPSLPGESPRACLR
jgi:hypothetical protein